MTQQELKTIIDEWIEGLDTTKQYYSQVSICPQVVAKEIVRDGPKSLLRYIEEVLDEQHTDIGNPLYYQSKDEALKIGKRLRLMTFVETMALVLENTHEITGGRSTEIMEQISHLLRCREVCQKHGLMREVLRLDRLPPMCRIVGSEIEFDLEVPESDIEQKCREIYNNPLQYSKYEYGTEDAWNKFLKFLWVKFSDGHEKYFGDIVNGR